MIVPGKVAIYGIATIQTPTSIRYIGSAIDPLQRFKAHSTGRDSGYTKRWFLATRGEQKNNHVCYIIEWVDSAERYIAEGYWYYVFNEMAKMAEAALLINDAPRVACRRHIKLYPDKAQTLDTATVEAYRLVSHGKQSKVVRVNLAFPAPVTVAAINEYCAAKLATLCREQDEIAMIISAIRAGTAPADYAQSNPAALREALRRLQSGTYQL